MRIDTTSGDFDYTYLSLGAGVQSSALLVLSCVDERVPKPDVAIFADTGDEPPWVYEYLDELTRWAAGEGLEVCVAKKDGGKSLSESAIEGQATGSRRFISLPVFVPGGDGGRGVPLRRQCTREYKIDPINQKVRELLGYKPRQRVKESVRAMLGISIDEIQRMKPSWTKWVTNTYPLVDLSLSRHDCYQILDEAGLSSPGRSACVYCPYHSDDYWSFLKTEHPEVFNEAVVFDKELRAAAITGRSDGALKGVPYVHSSCVPLDEVHFNTTDPAQVDMWSECEGMCGV